MPIYEYRCESCGEEFEELVRLDTPDEEIECPACAQHTVKRRLSTFAVGGGVRLGTATSSSSAGCGTSGFG